MSDNKQAVDDVRSGVVRELHKLRTTLAKASLGTLLPGTTGPFVSLVLVAFDDTAAPLLLLSKLARHTRNLDADPRASLLLDGTDAAGDPMAGARLTLLGRITRTTDPTARPAFQKRHPSAAGYAEFADFAIYRMDVETGHLVAGFGRIVEVSAEDWKRGG